LVLGSKSRKKHQSWSIDCASTEDGLALGVEYPLLAVLECEVDAGDLVALDVDLADPSIGKNGQVLALLLASENGMDVRNTSAAPSAVIWVVGY
jgi:hypothetical protein